MKSTFTTLALLFTAAAASAAVPEVTSVTLTQDGSTHKVKIAYTMTDAPAIVTVDIQTNGVSIGGQNLWHMSGDVNKLVAAKADDAYSIEWDAVKAWPDHKIKEATVRAVVTAWNTSCPPDYMAVDLVSGERAYYPDEASVPGGVTGNDVYKSTVLLMRKIHAAGIPWQMGSIGEIGRSGSETAHTVTLENDYYMGVFPVTQAQWASVMGSYPSGAKYTTERAYRPAEGVSYRHIRESADNTEVQANFYPRPPASGSFLATLRGRTKDEVAFDLPGEAQWEFAARGGYGEGLWPDGSSMVYNYIYSTKTSQTDANLNRLGVNSYNGGNSGTVAVGSLKPNGYGLYDVCGNVYEWCLDWYVDDISTLTKGEVNANGTAAVVGDNSSWKRVVRGGRCNMQPHSCRPAVRGTYSPSDMNKDIVHGFRVCVPLP